MRLAVLVLLLAGGLASSHAAAAPSACPRHHPGGQAPDLLRPRLAAGTEELCFREFAVIASGVSRTPLAAAEHLTLGRLRAAEALPREDAFHEEPRLPPEWRARLGDYARSGFDRGHMAPAGDMATPEGLAESFSLANMVPQAPGSNRCLWEGIERAVRDLVEREGEAWVLTGPIFEGEALQRLNGRVLVPTSLYKAVYLPGRREAAAYVAPNGPGEDWRAMPLAALRDLAGLAAFPAVATEARVLDLPAPRPRTGGVCAGGVVAERRAPAGQAARSGAVGTAAMALAALAAVLAGGLLVRALGRR